MARLFPPPAAAFAAILLAGVGMAGPVAAAGAVLVMDSGAAALSVIDLAGEREVRRIPVLREPHHWTLTPDRRDLLVGDTVGNELLDLDPVTFALRRRIPVSDPYQLGFSPDGKLLVVNGLNRNQIDVYDAATYQLVHRFPVSSRPSHLAFSPDSAHVFVSLQGTNRLISIDLRRMTVEWTVPVGSTPAGVLWLDGHVLVADMGNDDIAVVDAADGRVLRRVHTGKGAHQIFLAPDGKSIFVTNRVDSTSVQLDAATLATLHVYHVPGGPDDVAFAPDGTLWFTLRFIGKVGVLNPATGTWRTIAVGRQPHGIYLSATAVP
jgi:DNA-binding beta-propeller fold protein YncE